MLDQPSAEVATPRSRALSSVSPALIDLGLLLGLFVVSRAVVHAMGLEFVLDLRWMFLADPERVALVPFRGSVSSSAMSSSRTAWFLFFAACTTLCWVRTTFHLAWFVAALGLACGRRTPRARVGLVFSCHQRAAPKGFILLSEDSSRTAPFSASPAASPSCASR